MAPKSKPQKGKTSTDDMFDDDSVDDSMLRTNLNSPTARVHESRRRRQTLGVYAFITVGTLCILSFVGSMVDPDETVEVPAASSTDVNMSLGKTDAHEYVTKWLGTDPSPLPGGYIVSWDGFDPISGGEPTTESDKPANDSELHHFTLATETGNGTAFYDVTLLVNVSDVLGSRVVGEPSLLPRIPSATQGWSSQVWPGYAETNAPDPVAQSVNQWAKAFTESPDALRLYIGDEDGSRSYMPLQGAKVISASVEEAGHIRVESEDVITTMLVRIELSVAWGESRTTGAPIQYDALVVQAHTASPKVVAWGPVGTGPTLTKYGNAIDDVKLVSGLDAPVPEDTATPEPEDGSVYEEESY